MAQHNNDDEIIYAFGGQTPNIPIKNNAAKRSLDKSIGKHGVISEKEAIINAVINKALITATVAGALTALWCILEMLGVIDTFGYLDTIKEFDNEITQIPEVLEQLTKMAPELAEQIKNLASTGPTRLR